MPCSVPTRNLVGWGWEQEGAAVSRMDTPRCGGQQEILLQPEPWDPPPWRGLGTGTPELGPSSCPGWGVGGGHRDTHQDGCKVQGDGTQSVLELILPADVQDQSLTGL